MSSASGPPEEGGQSTQIAGMLIGEYEVTARLGEGGMGTVYAVVHPVIGKRAAVKVISAALSRDQMAVERFIREARAVNEIGHPNVVDVFGFGQLPDGRHYLVMELLQGESLAERVARGPVPLAQALEVLAQIADTLQVVHSKGIVHRDLKPDNVFLVGDEPKIKLLDFGIAKLVSNDADRTALTSTGDILGTPLYMSPEQVQGAELTHKADVYALGVLAFEIVLGSVPFPASTPVEAAAKHLYEPPPDPRELWPGLQPVLADLIVAMLSKRPELRPELADVRSALRAAASSIPRVREPSGRFAYDETLDAASNEPAHDAGEIGHVPTVTADELDGAAMMAPPEPAPATAIVAGGLERARRPKGMRALLAALAAAVLAVAVIAVASISGDEGAAPPSSEEADVSGTAADMIVVPLSQPMRADAGAPADAGSIGKAAAADAAATPAEEQPATRASGGEARPRSAPARRTPRRPAREHRAVEESPAPTVRQPPPRERERDPETIADDPDGLVDPFGD